ncbi:Lrp/AsnC family transcriptional regulator [Vreelandella lionensis]|uniref:Lrp/AsnC family transcriptional regulator n=1 Tax=Vreelandella lionensis TaxID=1144478 RepID=UPI0009F4D9C1|nr:Lrp/AsnC family transcriptional regulator [Halomonas lionensis]
MSVSPLTLDRFDRRILDVLQVEGRISNQELAERIGLSPSPCLRRVRALEEHGLITQYRAVVDARPLGFQLMALLHISMDQHTPERFDNFERHIRTIPNVVECLIITGQAADFQLKILVKDMDDYQHLLLHVINRIEGVTGAHTSFVLRRVFEHRPVPT